MALTTLGTFTGANVWAAEVSYRYATVGEIKIFYREAGDPGKPTILLLHGFPSSSHQFRDLIPLLSANFHVVAPDYPGMGHSEAPPADRFTPTFDDLTKVMTEFVEKLGDRHLIVYMTDFGGPVGMRMAVSHPDWIAGLVFQNANISLDGVDPARLKRNQENAAGITPARRAEAAAHVSMATALRLYKDGTRNPDALNPDAWTNDEPALLDPESRRIMIDLQLDTPANIALFPVWQDYLRTRRPKTLVVWGKGDRFFLPAGADAIKKLVPAAEVHNYDTGHFALEEDHVDIAKQINRFFAPSASTAHPFDENDRQEVKAVFLRQAAAATAHDLAAFEQVFASTAPGQPDPVAFVARAYQFWGKPALIEHFKETFQGVWRFEPDAERVKVIPLTPDSAEIYAPTQVTFGASKETAKTAPFLVYEVAVRTPEGWRIAAIVPVPAS